MAVPKISSAVSFRGPLEENISLRDSITSFLIANFFSSGNLDKRRTKNPITSAMPCQSCSAVSVRATVNFNFVSIKVGEPGFQEIVTEHIHTRYAKCRSGIITWCYRWWLCFSKSGGTCLDIVSLPLSYQVTYPEIPRE